jgi:hypothetical protein
MVLQRLAHSIVIFSLISSTTGQEDIFGLRKNIYEPRCAHACRTAIQESPLECLPKGTKSSRCYASNEPFLQTLALCISSHCADVSEVDIEKFWSNYVIGWKVTVPQPVYAYQTALNLAGQPTSILQYGNPIDRTYQVAEKDYLIAYTSLADWNGSEVLHTRFA